jgi:hypothetical protein
MCGTCSKAPVIRVSSSGKVDLLYTQAPRHLCTEGGDRETRRGHGFHRNLRGIPALNFQARDAPEMSNVPCHQCQAMRQSGGGNQNIGIADELPFTIDFIRNRRIKV